MLLGTHGLPRFKTFLSLNINQFLFAPTRAIVQYILIVVWGRELCCGQVALWQTFIFIIDSSDHRKHFRKHYINVVSLTIKAWYIQWLLLCIQWTALWMFWHCIIYCFKAWFCVQKVSTVKQLVAPVKTTIIQYSDCEDRTEPERKEAVSLFLRDIIFPCVRVKVNL